MELRIKNPLSLVRLKWLEALRACNINEPSATVCSTARQ